MSTAHDLGSSYAGISTASIRPTASPAPSDSKSGNAEEPRAQLAIISYPPDDELSDYDAERGTLLPPADLDRPPWANALDRVQHKLMSRPRVRRVVDAINWVLGPTERRPPPPPTGLALTCACTGGRRRLAAPLDPIAVHASKRGKLPHFYLLYLALWAAGFILLIRAAYYQPGSPPSVSCTAGPWDDWPPDTCGLDMTECAAKLEEGTYRCPGGCQLVKLGNPRWVGGEKVNKRPLIIGDGVYRADSWVCAAGLHSGIISHTYGGCLRVKPIPYPTGSSNFTGSSVNGLTSAAFGPHFPGAFTVEATGSWSDCMDYHWPISAYNVVALFAFTALFAPRPGVLLTTILVMGYAHVVLVSNPPTRPPLWSRVFQGVPATLLAGFWAWHVSFRRSLTGFYTAQLPVEVALWQGAGLWIGLESSTLFSRIPISRLGYGSLGADGVIALVAIILIVGAVVLIQAALFRRLGLVRYYLARYLPLVPILVVLANLGHNYYLRLHHYLLALAGLPVMSLPNRISLFGAAFCLGFFLDGSGRWGWASIVEGGWSLLGDAASGSAMPNVTSVAGPSGYISWPAINATLVAQGIRSVAILFDDVLVRSNFTGTNFSIADGTKDRSVDHYFRMAYIANGTSLDYTDPLTWHASNESWSRVQFS
ncbi:hypothetical protein CC85DRAFT_281969 [Cutaneotrichosporon oleaginosum]|uniref:LCCL domain-containing protein n=1 Tax=Cutaneotrichosporon oleaginosum TaxID=879819 RepID=A0A0J0XXP8_9TREE|nr:uncharacterized protein CC85DRAFT_281969 [Cutaneotrichosporon oleaginosum]KLT45813.1 hypothetical protein CC85DRAFT_281969 [Cutaneotrichosporon oleaginosum]TXT06520.1 hypothetical protein COLE_05851 [Cutaneotrichosporon oleaginosum]